MKKSTLIAGAIFLVLVIAGAAYYYYESLKACCEEPPPRPEKHMNQDYRAKDMEQQEEAQIPKEIEWEQTSFLDEVGVDVRIVSDMLTAEDGRVFVTYQDQKYDCYLAFTEDGETWTNIKFPTEITNVRAIRQISNGDFIIAVGQRGGGPLVYRSSNGEEWEAFASDSSSEYSLPNSSAETAWDVVELSDGTLMIATDGLNNDPNELNETVYLYKDGVLSPAAALPGLGVLTLELGEDDTVYASIEESSEHDDADTAGQARIFVTEDAGESWKELAAPEGANRVYDILVDEGVIYLASGIRGDFYRSEDGGKSWITTTHIPAVVKPRGANKEMTEVQSTRIYQIYKLEDGRLIVGSGNNTGEMYVTSDGGDSWEQLEDFANNNVVWGITQDHEGTIWIGTGSIQGDVFRSK